MRTHLNRCLVGAVAICITSVTTLTGQVARAADEPPPAATVDGWAGTLDFESSYEIYDNSWDQPLVDSGFRRWNIQFAPTEFAHSYSTDPQPIFDETGDWVGEGPAGHRWEQGFSARYTGEENQPRLTRTIAEDFVVCSPSFSRTETSNGFITFAPPTVDSPNLFTLAIEAMVQDPANQRLFLEFGPYGDPPVPIDIVDTHDNNCPNDGGGPEVTEYTGDASPSMSNGLGDGLVQFDPPRWPVQAWPMPPDANGQRRLVGGDIGTTIEGDPASGTYAVFRFEYSYNLVWVPAGVDTDGDGIFDSNDNCPGASNPLQEDIDRDGIGDVCDPTDDRTEDPEDPDDPNETCAVVDDPSWQLGYAEPVYRVGLLVSFCFDGATVDVKDAYTSSDLVMSPSILALWSVAFKWEPESSGADPMKISPNADGSVNVSSAYTYGDTPFEICFSPLDLIPGLGKGVSKALSWVPGKARGKIIGIVAEQLTRLIDADKSALEELLLSASDYLAEGTCLPAWVPEIELRIRPDGTVDWVSDPLTSGGSEYSWLYVTQL